MLVTVLFWTSSAFAQTKVPTAYDRAIAAGYKALTLCSGIFDAEAVGAHRERTSIEANELVGIYPEYDALIPAMRATISRGSVMVEYDPAMPPRLAVSGLRGGCVLQPIGVTSPPSGYLVVMADGPRGNWPATDANALAKPHGDAAGLHDSIRRAFRNEFGKGTNSTAVVIVQNGKIVGERYAAGFGIATPQRTWSVAKSLAGSIIGAAVLRTALDTDSPTGIPEWQAPGDPRAAITWDNLLRMGSGLHSGAAGNRTDAIYFGGTAVTEEATAWPIEAPRGKRFRYANDDILLAVRALRARFDRDRNRDFGLGPNFPDDLLFSKLDMIHTIAETDWRGNYILSSQVWSTARDLARFGLLYLNDGVWNGERILPQGWVKYVTTPSGPQPDGAFGYGATFWLMNKSPGVPTDTFAAFGNRGQYVVIVPSRKVVIVRRGEDPVAARFDIARFTADVLAALR